jgi:predicted phosphodiesterase
VALVVALSSVALSGCAVTSGAETLSPSTAATNAAFTAGGTVAIIGDFGSGDANERAVADLVAAASPEAVLTVGDNVYTDAGYARQVGDYYGAFVAGERFFPATGNHDYDQGIENFDDYFGYLNGQRDYTVVLGSAEFFVLDGEQGMSSLDANHNQEMWLRRVVSASTADYKIVIVHYPPFSSGDRHGSTPDYQWDFASIGIDLVLSGHDHIYERIELGGVAYVVNGAGGKTLYACGDRVTGSVTCFDEQFGALFLTPRPDGLFAEFVAVDGRTVDSFLIPAET